MNRQEIITEFFFTMISEYPIEKKKQLFEKTGISEEEFHKEFPEYLSKLDKETFEYDFDLMTTKIENITFSSKNDRLKNVLHAADIVYVWQIYAWPQKQILLRQPSNFKPEFMYSFMRFYGSGKTTAAQLIDTLQVLGLPPLDTVTFSYQELELLETSM